MPISVKRDIKPLYGFGARFQLGDTPTSDERDARTIRQVGGRYLPIVKEPVADQNWDEFHSDSSWTLQGLSVSKTKGEVLKAVASKFNLAANERGTFDDLWTIASDADAFKKDSKDEIAADLEAAYRHAAVLARGGSVKKKTFEREEIRRDSQYVVFSDHHMTAFAHKPNFFGDFNEKLYLAVLDRYAEGDWVLVENGDVEECVIYEPNPADASERNKQAGGKGKFPIVAGEEWAAFLETRYDQRKDNLDAIIGEFPRYYQKVGEFIADDRYVRLTGNHDTYLDDGREGELKECIEKILGTDVHDVLKIMRSPGRVDYVILHGHQFDSVSMQHGSTPWAKSLGEVYSECLSWAFEGPDRFWTTQDTKRWYIGGEPFKNVLAVEEPSEYHGGGDGIYDLVMGNKKRIKEDPRSFLEQLLGYEIAWEYFENANGYNALMLEVWTGDELYKARHMSEVALGNGYLAEFFDLGDVDPVPPLVLGHTHEPRRRATFPGTTNRADWYLNSGSVGRFQNLIWCVEILADDDQICSWSIVDGRLQKIVWSSEIEGDLDSVLVPGQPIDEGPV